jgi:hypothetical protein
MNKLVLFLLMIISSVSFAGEYRIDIKNQFEKDSFVLVSFNKIILDMFKVDSTENNISHTRFVEIHHDHYIVETILINCAEKTTKAVDQKETLDNMKTTRYIVDSPFERVTKHSRSEYLYKLTCQ